MSRSREGTVDVSAREETARHAVAEGFLLADPDTIEALRTNALHKADPLATARAVALLAVKSTATVIPHCHPIRVTATEVEFEFSVNSVRVTCRVRAVDRTGPPMEAMHGVSAALLTLYDMVKRRCPTATMDRIVLLEKGGGRSGQWRLEGRRCRAGTVVEVCTSEQRGVPKTAVGRIRLIENRGVQGDAHAGDWPRQVSLLCEASAEKLRDSGFDLAPGAFAENVRISGLAPEDFRPGTVLRFQRGAVLEVTQIGKECHVGCDIARRVGRCAMPKEGVFARVVRGGEVCAGDALEVLTDETEGGRAGDE